MKLNLTPGEHGFLTCHSQHSVPVKTECVDRCRREIERSTTRLIEIPSRRLVTLVWLLSLFFLPAQTNYAQKSSSGSPAPDAVETGTTNESATANADARPQGATPSVSIKIATPSGHNQLLPPDNQFIIDATPKMPLIQYYGQVVGVDPDPTPTTTFTWTVMLRSRDGKNTEIKYDNKIVQKAKTVGHALFTLQFITPNTFLGGDLKIIVQAVVNGQLSQGSTPAGLRIVGKNPQRSAIQANISSQVASPISGLAAADVSDALKRMACHESSATSTSPYSGQRQFDAQRDGGVGRPYAAPDNGVGIFQITRTTRCPNNPFTACPNAVFNWKENVTYAVDAFKEKVSIAGAYPGKLRNAAKYKDFLDHTINPARQAADLLPIPTTLGSLPAPDFTLKGKLGATPKTNQLLEDAVRGFNGFAGSKYGLLQLHEFTPDENFLRSATNAQLPDLSTNSLVWRRVLSTERPASGEPDYVNKVTAKAPTCP